MHHRLLACADLEASEAKDGAAHQLSFRRTYRLQRYSVTNIKSPMRTQHRAFCLHRSVGYHFISNKPQVDGSSIFIQLVEPRRIELRSILNCPQGATGLVSDQDSERIGSQTNVAAPSRFNLSHGHTDYVPWGIPLK